MSRCHKKFLPRSICLFCLLTKRRFCYMANSWANSVDATAAAALLLVYCLHETLAVAGTSPNLLTTAKQLHECVYAPSMCHSCN